MRRRFLLALVLALLLPAAPALADGDPASDVLLSQDVFFPYQPNDVTKPLQQALVETVKRAKAKGFPVKVALIADERDLGAASQLVGDPQKYADLLTQEISINVVHGRGVKGTPVLVVFPSGIGGDNLGDNAGDALGSLLPPADSGADGLARTAAIAIGKLAAADGKPIALPALPQAATGPVKTGGGGFPPALLFAAPIIVVVIVVLVLNARPGKPEEPPVDEPLAS